MAGCVVNIVEIIAQIGMVIVMCFILWESVRSRKMEQLPIVIPALSDINEQNRIKLEVKNVGSGPALNVTIILKKEQDRKSLPLFNVVGINRDESMPIERPHFFPNDTTKWKPFTCNVIYLNVYRKKYELEIEYKTDNSSEVRLISGFEDYKI